MNESRNNDQRSGNAKYSIILHFSKAILTIQMSLLAVFCGEYGIYNTKIYDKGIMTSGGYVGTYYVLPIT